MCNLSKGVEEKGINQGINQGIKEGVLVSVRNLMESMGWSAEQAMSALKVPEAEQADYADELEKTANAPHSAGYIDIVQSLPCTQACLNIKDT